MCECLSRWEDDAIQNAEFGMQAGTYHGSARACILHPEFCISGRQNDLGIPNTCSPMYDRIRFVEIGAT